MSDVISLLVDGEFPPRRVGSLLRAARKRGGWNRRAAASELGISVDALRAYERGEQPAERDVISALAELYGPHLADHVPRRAPVQVDDRWLVVGEDVRPIDSSLPDDVMQDYAQVLYRLRRARPGELVPLRATDLAALSAALGQSTDVIEAQIMAILGCSRHDAAELRTALLGRKLLVPVAGLVAGMGAFAAASAGAASGEPGLPAEPASTTPTTTTAAYVIADVTELPDFGEPFEVVAPPGDGAPVATAPPTATAAPSPVAEAAPLATALPDADAPTDAGLGADDVTDATVPPSELAPDAPPPVGGDTPVSIPPGETFVEIGTPIAEP